MLESAKQKRSIRSAMFSAIVKKKKKSKLSRSSNSSNSASEATSLSETVILKKGVAVETDGKLVKDLKTQLQPCESELEASENKIKQDEEANTTPMIHIQDQLDSKQSKFLKMGKGSEDVYLDEFFKAEVFKLKKQTEEMQQELGKRSDLDKQVNRLTEELVDMHMLNQELRFQVERSSTRSKMKSIIEEKNTKEEIQRLQKELRMTEQNMKIKTSSFEAQLKASQDGKDRLQEKARLAQTRFDELDKEHLELKIDNNRLRSKLEKSSMYAEKKRLQTEQETVELELNNLKRRNVKLEKQVITVSNQMLNITGFAESDYSSESDSHIPHQSLSESKMINLEKEVAKLEEDVTKLSEENKNLKEYAKPSDQTEDLFFLIKEQDDQLKTERRKVEGIGEDHLSGLLKQIEKLEQGSKDIEMRFRVKEKGLWSTIEAQKNQIEELEMKTLALELGENEEDRVSDTEESDSTPRPEVSSKRISELQKDIERLQNCNNQLQEYLQATLKQLHEAKDSCLSEQQQKWAVDDARQQELEKLRNVNDHLQGAFEESVAENRKFQSAFVSFQEEFKSLENQNKELIIDLDKAMLTSMQVPILQSEIERLKQEEVELGAAPEVSSLEKEVESLNMLNSQLMKDLEIAEEELEYEEGKMEETEKLRIEIEKLKKENEILHTHLKSTEDELDKLEANLIEHIRVQKKEIKNLKKENAELWEAAAGQPMRDVTLKEDSTPPPPLEPKTPEKVESVSSTKDCSKISLPDVLKTKEMIITSGMKPSGQVRIEKVVSEVEETQMASSLTSKFKKP